MHNQPGMTSSKAYDIARKEFYNLRRAEEIERRVAREEALSTGAYFGKGVLEVGMELEDQAHEAWKKWAYEQLETMKLQRAGAYTGVGTGEDEGIDTEEVSEDAEPSLL
jgi:small subunit ribosomal protein S23